MSHDPAAIMKTQHRWLMADGKTPISAGKNMGERCNPSDEECLGEYEFVKASAEHFGYGIGYSIDHKSTGIWGLDIDDCRDPNSPNGLSALANELIETLPGCAVEWSQSGNGLHLYGSGQVPPHSCRPPKLNIEFYTGLRFFVYTGTFFEGGDAGVDLSIPIGSIIVPKFFPPKANAESRSDIWTYEPCDGWDETLADDVELLRRLALKDANSPAVRLPDPDNPVATFDDLWGNNAEVLARVYPGNSPGGYDANRVDAALANRLLWGTGLNCERTRRLMYESDLKRDKWEQRPKWLEDTILTCPAMRNQSFAKPRSTDRPTASHGSNPAPGTGAEGDTKSNITIRLLERQGVTARYDERNRAYELCLPKTLLWNGRHEGCQPIDANELRQMCRIIGQQFKVVIKDVEQAILTMGGLNKFDPVMDYLESLEWDGVSRLDRLLTYYCRAEDNPLHRAYGRHFGLGAVARTYWPGCKHDEVLALTGPQGFGKSSFAQILGGDWHSDADILGLDAKELIERTVGAFIQEFPEVRLIGRDGDKIKAYLSTTHHKARAAYGKGTEKVPARWVHVSTGNNEQFLTDATGNRRWHVVPVSEVRLDELKRDRDQIWAEAVAIFKSLHPNWQDVSTHERRIHFPRDLWAAQDAQAEEARLRDPWEELLIEAIRTGNIILHLTSANASYPVMGFATSNELLHGLRKMGATQTDSPGAVKRLATVCRGLNWKSHQQKCGTRTNGRGYLISVIEVDER